MADWSQLPKELLILIAKGLETRFDVIRFRSVCSTWRSSAPPKPRLLPVRIPIPIPYCDYDDYCVIRRTIFLIGLPHQSHVQWLVKIEECENEGMKLLNPLSNSIIKPLVINFPNVLDLLNFRVIELGHEYILQCCKTYVSYDDYLNREYPGMLCTNKVAFTCSSSDSNDYTLLDLFTSMNIFKSQDKQWTIIKDKSYWGYDDAIHFNGKFYVLGRSGEETFIVDPSLNVSSLVHLGSRSDKKLLVESGGELLLVDVYLNKRQWKSSGFPDEIAERLGSNAHNMMVWFDVFKLDEAGLKWDKVESLGDRLLFLGDYCTFSATASEFSGVEGNHIIFRDNFYRENLTFGGAFKESDIYVFSLENSSLRPLKDCPGYSKLFWPPPHWVISPTE